MANKANSTPEANDSAVIAAPPIPQSGVAIAAKPGVVEHVVAPHLGGHILTVKTN